MAAAEPWVASATERGGRRFGAVSVDLTEESDGSLQLFVDSTPEPPTGERVDFEVDS